MPSNDITHADASARVETLRIQMRAIEADLAAAGTRRDNHECEAVLGGTEIDTSFRTAVDDLALKHSTTYGLLRIVDARLEDIRQKEAAADAAAKRAVAGTKVDDLLGQYRDKTGAAIASVFTAKTLFLETISIRTQIRSILESQLPGDARSVPLFPPTTLNLVDQNAPLDIWAADLCALGFAEFVPDSMLAKKRFIAKQVPAEGVA